MAVVVDASAVAGALVGRGERADVVRRRLATEVCHAPYLLDAELGSVLRRCAARGDLGASDALRLLQAAEPLIDRRYASTGALAAAAWALRANVSYYDAVYVALARALDVVLLTADRRLARAPRLPCRVELVDL